MSSVLEAIRAQAALAAETGDDMNEAQKGGGGARLLPEGWAMARFVEYIEFGQQPQEFNGKPKDPAMNIQLGFALYGENYANEDGTGYTLRTFDMALSRNEKAKTFLAFKQMNYKGQAKHFAQLLGEGFLVYVGTHTPEDKTKKPMSRIDLKKGILPPMDPVSRMPYPIPVAADDLYRVFLWDYPTLDAWEALKIEGTNDSGKSKDFIRDKMIAAVDFQGSALETLLVQNGKLAPKPAAPVGPGPALPGTAQAAPVPSPAATSSAPIAAAQPVMPVSPVVAPSVPATSTPTAPVAAPVGPAPVPAVAVHVAPAPAVSTPAPIPAATMPAMPSMPAMPAMPVAA